MPAIILFLMVLFCQPVSAAGHPCAVGESVRGVVSGQSGNGWFALEGDGKRYFVAGLMVPGQVSAAFYGLQPAPGSRVTVFNVGSVDRYGRTAVQIFVGDDWWQGQLLREGRALLFGNGLKAGCLAAMRVAEEAGERRVAGVWQRDQLVFPADEADELGQLRGHFVLVMGKIMSVGDRSRVVYLNFGQNWSQDFTVSVAKKGAGAFKGDVARLAGLKNRTVRVRGILDFRQGPLIRLSDEAQIEVLD